MQSAKINNQRSCSRDNKFTLLVACFALLSFSSMSCSDSEDKKAENNSAIFEYELDEYQDLSLKTLKCTTGKKTFSTLDSMCVGLANESFNNYCHQVGREQIFIQIGCPGTFPPYDTAATKPPITVEGSTPSNPPDSEGADNGKSPPTGNSGSGNPNPPLLSSPMQASLALVMPSSMKGFDCAVEYQMPLVNLAPVSDDLLKTHPITSIKTEVDGGWLHSPQWTNSTIKIGFVIPSLFAQLPALFQTISANPITLSSIDFGFRSGKIVKVTLAKECEKADDVFFVTEMSKMKRPGSDVNQSLFFEILKFDPQMKTCTTSNYFTLEQFKQKNTEAIFNSYAVAAAKFKADYGLVNSSLEQKIIVRLESDDKSNSLENFKRLEITTTALASIDVMKNLKASENLKFSANKECTDGRFGTVYLGTLRSE